MTSYPPIVLNAYLIALLKQEGIEVNPPAAIAIYKIIQRHQEDNKEDFSALKYLITPILSRTREEQQKIYDILDHLDEKFEQAIPLPEIEIKEPEIPTPPSSYEKLVTRLTAFVRHNWIPVVLFLLVATAALWYYMFRYAPFRPRLIVNVPPVAVVNVPVHFTASVNDSARISSYRVQWMIHHEKDSSGWQIHKTFTDSGSVPFNVYLFKGNTVLDSFITILHVNCEPVPEVNIREVPSIASTAQRSQKNNEPLIKGKNKNVTNTATGKRRKSYEPVFQNASPDSAKYSYRWYVNDHLEGTDKVFSYLKPQEAYHSIRLAVDCHGTHCSTDSLSAKLQEKKAIAFTHVQGQQPLTLRKNVDARNLLYSLFYLLVIPGIIAGSIYFARKKLWFRVPEKTKWDKDLPQTYTFSNADHLIHPESGLRLLADILRKRQVTISHRMDIPQTIDLSIRSWGVPQLAFQEGSTASEFLVLLDREYGEGHLTYLFTYLCRQLGTEQVNLILYDYYKQPLLLNSQSLQLQLVPVERLAALYPGSTLIIFGQSIHFVSSLKNTLKPWVIEKFRQWDKKIFVTGYAVNDWDKKETLLSQAGFFVVSSDIIALPKMEPYLFEVDTSRGFTIPGTYTSRRLSFDSIETLQEYFREFPLLFQWVCALAVYPVPNWQVTLRIGNTLEQLYKDKRDDIQLLNYTNLLMLSRISWMQDGNWNESLKAALLARLPNDVEAAVREALNKEVQDIIITLPEGSVAKKELENYHLLNKFLLDAYQQQRPSLKNSVAVQQILASDQVDAAHKIYLDSGGSTMLHAPGKPDNSVDTATYMREVHQPVKRKLLMEALTILSVLGLLVYLMLYINNPELLQWRKVLPVTKSVALVQQLSQPQTLYADLIVGDRHEQITFARDTVITFGQVQIRDTSDQMYFRISADTASRNDYDSFALRSVIDTLIATEPVLVHVTIVAGDPVGLVLADSLEQALPSNFVVNRQQGVQTDTSLVISYSDTSLLNEVQSLNAIINRLFNQTGGTILNTASGINGIRVSIGNRSRYIMPSNPSIRLANRDSVTRNNNVLNPPPVITRNAAWYFSQGQRMYEQSRYAESVRYYDSAIQLNPKDPLAYYNRALGYEQLYEYSSALRDYQVAININPNDALSNFRMAEIEFDQKDYTKAIENYSRVITINSSYITTTNITAYYKRGEAYRLINNMAGACADYQRAADGGNQQASAAISTYCSKQPPPNAPANTGKTILWVSTSPQLTLSIRNRIESSGNKITSVIQPAEAEKYLSGYARSIDVVVYAINANDYDDKGAIDFLGFYEKYNLPLILLYYEYKYKPSAPSFTGKNRNVKVATSADALMRALENITTAPAQQYRQQAK